ncbi:MAG: ABC transporter permease [Clostridia bacterium]|nr:ABC transporter permease [Clostridia bacterium]
MTEKKRSSEPLVRISARTVPMPALKAWGIRLGAIVAALLLAAVFVVTVTGLNPFEVYASLWKGAFGSLTMFKRTVQNTAVLLCISLAVTPAFKMRFWNIGAEGQVMAGCIATAACMILVGDKLPTPLLMLVMVITSILAGVIWAVIPAFFKANWNTNETLFTLMMNYIAIQVTSYLSTVWENPAGSAHIGVINMKTKVGWFPSLFGEKYLLNILIVAAITAAVYVYLKYSKHGYEISVVGESERTAKYVGMNVKKVILRTMALSGAICGIAGLIIVAGTDHTLSTTSVGGKGFTAVMVSWLAKFNPALMVFASLLISFLEKGAGQIASDFRIDPAIADILTGIILFFIIGCEFFINYKLNFRHKASVEAGITAVPVLFEEEEAEVAEKPGTDGVKEEAES